VLGTARLDADQRWWQLAEEANYLISLQLPPLDALAFTATA
jgi:hypothetical protein